MKKKKSAKPAAKKKGSGFDAIKKSVQDALSGKGAAAQLGEWAENKGGEIEVSKLEHMVAERVAGKVAPAEKKDIERIKTGIPGLDELITGGIPRDSTILLSGSPGAGKTIFALQFLVNGAKKFNEPGLYVSFEEEPASIKEGAKLFGWDFDEMEKKKQVQIIFEDPYNVKNFASALSGQIYSTLKDSKAKRVVFDSITYLGVSAENDFKLRKEIAELGKRLKHMDITSLFISEAPEGPSDARLFRFDEFAADGVVRLYNLLIKGTRQRAIEVMKLRKTNHDTFLHPFSIGSEGIVVYPKEQVFGE